MTQLFFAYPDRPPGRKESVVSAAAELGKSAGIHALTWESLKRGSGRLVINKVTDAILDSDVVVADVTDANDNVLFEIGYAVGNRKIIWLIRDDTFVAANSWWKRFGVLSPVEYSNFQNSRNIVESFWSILPHESTSLYDDQIQPQLSPSKGLGVLYLQSPFDTEAESRVGPRISAERSNGLVPIVIDPRESSVSSLGWYAEKIYQSAVVVAHFTSPGRDEGAIHNNRAALISGLARGMGKPVLMLAEQGYETPLDYMDVLREYTTGGECLAIVNRWLDETLPGARVRAAERSEARRDLELAVELRDINFGESVAELEEDDLSDYFVETSQYDDVMSRGTRVFIGSRGSGKTANLYRAAADLAEDPRNLVCVIKPPSYELSGLIRLVREFTQRDARGYVIESIWKFIIVSEIACSARDWIHSRPEPPQSGSAEDALLRFFAAHPFIGDDFAARLETAIDGLSHTASPSGVREQRLAISEGLHEGLLGELRTVLSRVLADRERVAVLVDNLDKDWDQGTDIEDASHLILGLLASIGRVEQEFAKADHRRHPVTVSLVVFLRSDIYDRIKEFAREPDKIAVTRLMWDDPELLQRVIEERYLSNRAPDTPPSELWSRYFPEPVDGLAASDYILSRVLPRPRDFIRFCQSAIGNAINARRGAVTLRDIVAAEKVYSLTAMESLKVENAVGLPLFENVVYEFTGASSIVDSSEIEQAVERAGVTSDARQRYIDRLFRSGFFGCVIDGGPPMYVYDPADEHRMRARARRAEARGQSVRWAIHPAFRTYLEVEELPEPRT